MQKFFITGGAGFIGSAFIRLVLNEIPNCTLINFDALTYAGNLDNLHGLDPERHQFVRGDIADPAAVLAALTPGIDAIINFAAGRMWIEASHPPPNSFAQISPERRFCWMQRGTRGDPLCTGLH